MNAERRKKIEIASYYLNEARNIIDRVLDTERDVLYKIPESFENKISEEEDIIDYLDDAMDDVMSAIENIENIAC